MSEFKASELIGWDAAGEFTMRRRMTGMETSTRRALPALVCLLVGVGFLVLGLSVVAAGGEFGPYGTGMLVGFGLFGLILIVAAARRPTKQSVSFHRDAVTVRQRGLLGQRIRHYSSLDFVGLSQTMRHDVVRRYDTAMEKVARGLLFVFGGILGWLVLKRADRKMYEYVCCLTLRHRHRRRLDILLMVTDRQGRAREVATELCRAFSIPQLDDSPGVDEEGADRNPDAPPASLIHRLAPSRMDAALPPEPLGITIKESGEVLTVLMPRWPYAWILGGCLGTPFLAFGLWGLIGWLQRGEAISGGMWMFLAIVTSPGVAFWIAGIRKSMPRPLLSFRHDDVRIHPRTREESVRPLPWYCIHDVSVDLGPTGRRRAIVTTTDVRMYWIATGKQETILQWLHDVILAKASEVAGQSRD